jgi:replicative DNA helicase
VPAPVPVSADRIERTPPHDLEAEVCVLGSMLLDAEVIGEVVTLLRAEDFYREGHRRMFDTMVSLFDAGKGVDAVLVREELRRRGDLEAAGGAEAIVNLLDRVPTAAHSLHYAGIVRDASIRRGIIAAADRVIRGAFEGASEGRELLDEAEASFFALDRDSELNEGSAIGDILKDVFYKIDRIQNREGAITGLETGFYDLDEKTSGLQPGEMIVVAGRPSMGKTTLALCIMEHAAVVGKQPVALFSMEMGREQIVQNVLCSRAKVESQKLRRGFLADEDYAKLSGALAGLSEAKIFVDDTPGLTPLALRSRARRLHKKEGIRLVIVDYLQLMSGGLRMKQENRQQEISFISRSMKELARELSVPVIAISQLNRGVEDRADHRPMMSDLRESGAIEQDADLVLLLHRPEYYEHDEQRKREIEGEAELIIAKHRNGPTGTVNLTFLSKFMRFENGAKDRF